ncbi:MAG: bifunctional sulfate adenylyltransferase/adenylylsulfate kinase [Candidatus Dormibacteraeota bacterium]|nr:bifunctional sulfate adenylyltransferase/adenylylsulfate kinase [Candidatus Dormibacteraeota bacterium]
MLEATGASDSADSHRPAHGGELVDLLVSTERAAELKAASAAYPSWDLTDRQVCDLELLMNGAFSPLRGFLGREAYDTVCSEMRLPDGTIWPMPIVLDLTEDAAAKLHPGDKLALRDSEGVMLAVLNVEELYQPDRESEAQQVFGTTDPDHPGVAMLLKRTNPVCVGGSVEGIQLPTHYDFAPVRLTPRQVRSEIARQGWTRVVAFQTRNPMHRAHQELTLRAAASVDAKLLIHPVVGMTKPGDVDHYTRVRCYEAMLGRYPEGTAMLSLLPLAMRMGGPREAVWHAIIRKNYGSTHLIVGRDHAGPGKRKDGTPFYGPYEAQEVLGRYADEIGIGMVAFQMLVYVAERDEYFPEDEVPQGLKPLNISGTELRERLATGAKLPSWFTYPEVARELRRTHRPRLQQGFTVFFTGLSGSGKSTVANVLQVKLLERGGRSLSVLDGDLVRRNLSSELGFSREHRDINIRRIGYVAAEITKAGGIAICAPIAPYDATRKQVRAMVEPNGGFVLVHLATSIDVCEARDRKGLYAKARAGIVKEFTGVSDPYEEPHDAELVVDTAKLGPSEAADQILSYLEREGFLDSTTATQ